MFGINKLKEEVKDLRKKVNDLKSQLDISKELCLTYYYKILCRKIHDAGYNLYTNYSDDRTGMFIYIEKGDYKHMLRNYFSMYDENLSGVIKELEDFMVVNKINNV